MQAQYLHMFWFNRLCMYHKFIDAAAMQRRQIVNRLNLGEEWVLYLAIQCDIIDCRPLKQCTLHFLALDASKCNEQDDKVLCTCNKCFIISELFCAFMTADLPSLMHLA